MADHSTIKGWFITKKTKKHLNNNKQKKITTATSTPLPLSMRAVSPSSPSPSPAYHLPSASASPYFSSSCSSSYSPLASTAPSSILHPPPPRSSSLRHDSHSSSTSTSSLNHSTYRPISPASSSSTASPLKHNNIMHQQRPQQLNNSHHDEANIPHPYNVVVLPSNSSYGSSGTNNTLCTPPINNDLFIAMTMNPQRSAPRPPTEIRIRGSATPTSPSSRNSNSSRSSTNQRHVRHQSANSTGSNLDKSLPLPPFACSQDSTTTGTNNSGANSPLSWAKMGSGSTDGSSNENTHHKVDQLKPTNGGHKRLLKGLKTRLRSHSFSSSSSSSRDTTTHLPTATPSSPGSGSSLAVNESVAQEYAKTIKSLWKMVEDEERAYRLVEASHSLSGYIPTAAGANNNDAGRVVNRPPYVNTITAALRRPSLPMQLTVPPIQEEEEESPMKTTTTLKTPTAHKTNNSLMVSTIVEMDHTVADLEVSPVGFSDASDAEVETISSNDSEEDEDQAVVRVAQKISVYRGRSLCWSAGAI